VVAGHRRTLARLALAVAALGVVLGLSACSVTDPATSITENGATLNGRVHPRSGSTTWWFEYGQTATYGSATARVDAGTAGELVPVSSRVTGLTPGATYHFRTCAQRTGDPVACGEDRSFTTSSGRLAPGFQESVAFSGLTEPLALRFAADGRVFVAEKRGIVKVFDGVGDATPEVFADLRTQVQSVWDRGLLGLALDPDFPAKPFVYVLYTHDAEIGGTAPRWGDGCPTPPGLTQDGCVVSGRLSRLTADGSAMSGPEQVLVEDWCQQYPAHSVGSLAFGPDGSLYASGGDGAEFFTVDYGQYKNPCGDPPGDAGAALQAPMAEGGALRTQDLRTTADPVGLDGSIIRVDPETGEGVSGNPGFDSADRNTRRVVAHGLRNPFRITVRPGTGEVWIADPGWVDIEEINRLSDPAGGVIDNFGWPCYEGPGRQPAYEAVGLDLCEALYASGAHVPPFHSYPHSGSVVEGDGCSTGSSGIAGVAFGFYPSGPYPADFDGALFFADYARDCIWAMKRDGGALPSPSALSAFVRAAANPVDVQVAPSGELFYADFNGGTIRRVTYVAGNLPPIAVATADRTEGATPLSVTFDGSTSDDPDTPSPLSFAWDLDGDGQHDDSAAQRPSFSYTAPGTYTAELKVTDAGGATATDAVTITVGNTRPTATIATPSPGLSWKVGDTISFRGAAVDDQDGTLPAAALSWTLVLQHCESTCHSHAIQSWSATAQDSFVTPAHDYPSYLELRLTATDSGGLQDTQTMRLDPRTVTVTMTSEPSGLSLTLGSGAATTPFTRTVVEGSTSSIGAPSPQDVDGTPYAFRSWSDGGAAAHAVTAADDLTLTATFDPP
jgi:glucose/arabinose dehydrogenase